MSISEQVKKLREAVKSYRPYVPYYVIALLHNAADTIESLSAKQRCGCFQNGNNCAGVTDTEKPTIGKSVLVIDTPEKCDGCVLHGVLAGRQVCNAEIKRVKDENRRPDWCPLKEMPHKDNHDYMLNERMNGYAEGWNACIDELKKEVRK